MAANLFILEARLVVQIAEGERDKKAALAPLPEMKRLDFLAVMPREGGIDRGLALRDACSGAKAFRQRDEGGCALTCILVTFRDMFLQPFLT